MEKFKYLNINKITEERYQNRQKEKIKKKG